MKKIMLMTACFCGAAVAVCAEAVVSDAPEKPKIAVFDFTTIDIQGQKFYEYRDRREERAKQDSLSDADRDTIDERMLGWVKAIDANSDTMLRAHDLSREDVENERRQARYKELADKLLKSKGRSVVIGAEYMISELGKAPSVALVDRPTIEKAFLGLELGRAGADDKTAADMGKITGATHVLYGTVADFRIRKRTFKGYGVETENIEYSLDVLVKIVELKTGKIVFSDVFTGTEKELKTEFGEVLDSDRFSVLMKRAIQQAATAISAFFSPKPPLVGPDESRKLKLQTSSSGMCHIVVSPRGPKQEDVLIYVDDRKDPIKGSDPLLLRMGKHTLTVRAPGYEEKILSVDVSGGESFSPQMNPVKQKESTR